VTSNVLPQEDEVRKQAPVYSGVFGYFPMALFRVAAHSLRSDRKHNPENAGPPVWAREKSKDHLEALGRHLCELHTDPDYHLAAIAWRALAALQEHCEAQGYAPGASSRAPEPAAPAAAPPAAGVQYEIVDHKPQASGHQTFGREIFPSRAAAVAAIHYRISPEYWPDFVVREVRDPVAAELDAVDAYQSLRGGLDATE
jgi:hypothetical protein